METVYSEGWNHLSMLPKSLQITTFLLLHSSHSFLLSPFSLPSAYSRQDSVVVQ